MAGLTLATFLVQRYVSFLDKCKNIFILVNMSKVNPSPTKDCSNFLLLATKLILGRTITFTHIQFFYRIKHDYAMKANNLYFKVSYVSVNVC